MYNNITFYLNCKNLAKQQQTFPGKLGLPEITKIKINKHDNQITMFSFDFGKNVLLSTFLN